MAIKKQHQAERRKKLVKFLSLWKLRKLNGRRNEEINGLDQRKINWIFIPFFPNAFFSPLILLCLLAEFCSEGHFFSLSDIRCSIYWLPAVVCRWTFSGIIFSAQKKIHHQLEMKNYTHLISRGYTMLVQKWLDLVNCNFFPLLRHLSSCVEGKRIRGFASSFFAVCI